MQYELIGQTRDDAVGEAFDKVARLIGLPYPGGPEISRLAAESRKRGLTPFSFTPPMLHSKDFDFSFSGIKTEVRKLVESLAPLDETTKMEIACAFEDAVSEVLVKKTLRAVEEYGAQTVVVGGGVSANTYIRSQLAEALMKVGTTQLLIPPPELATDNAVMIAIAGYFHAIKHDYVDPATLRAQGNLKLV
jgi:N6-L-threonylcarbamoyladenine synthase